MLVKEAVDILINESRVNSKIEGPVFLGIKLTDPALNRPKYQPTLITLPNKVRRSDETTVCFVVQDPSAPIVEAINKNKSTQGLFDEVIGIKKLRRRIMSRKAGGSSKGADRFAKTFTAIFVQSEAHKDLIEVLGRDYYKRPRHIPVSVHLEGPISSEQTLRELRYIVKSTLSGVQLVVKPEATYASMRVGHTKMGAEKLLQNVEAAIEAARHKVPGGLGHTASFEIKTAESMPLSI